MITPAPKPRKLNPMLMKVLFISLAVHVVALILLGGWVIVKAVIPDEAQFEEPPVVVEETPPPEVKVEIKPQTQPLQNKLKMQPVANIAVANVDVNLPSMDDTFTVTAGLGGFGGGSLLGGPSGSLGMGMSDVSVFGLKTRAERILFIIDANRDMVTDKKGGLNSYKVIKDEITNMVGNLSAGTLFNVALKDRGKVLSFKNQLVPAGAEIHQQLIKWINPINSNGGNIGLENNSAAKIPQLKTLPGSSEHKALHHRNWKPNETAFITQYALEQNVDAIFLITSYHRGFEPLRRTLTDKEKADWEREQAKPSNQKIIAAHDAERPQMRERLQAELNKINAQRKSKGQPPRVLAETLDENTWRLRSNAKELGLKWKNPLPEGQSVYRISESKMIGYFRDVIDEIYGKNDQTPPSVNVVLFLAGDEIFKPEWKKQLSRYASFFKGKSRVIRGLNEIKSASSSKDSKN